MEIVAQITGAIAGTYLLAAVLPSNIVVNPTLVWGRFISRMISEKMS